MCHGTDRVHVRLKMLPTHRYTLFRRILTCRRRHLSTRRGWHIYNPHRPKICRINTSGLAYLQPTSAKDLSPTGIIDKTLSNTIDLWVCTTYRNQRGKPGHAATLLLKVDDMVRYIERYMFKTQVNMAATLTLAFLVQQTGLPPGSKVLVLAYISRGGAQSLKVAPQRGGCTRAYMMRGVLP